MLTTTHQAREARLRRLAHRQGLAIGKWRGGHAAGRYYMRNPYLSNVLLTGEYGLTRRGRGVPDRGLSDRTAGGDEGWTRCRSAPRASAHGGVSF